jgi:peptidoglycan hydrolase-like protein with peptidoglycan-binding domain
MQANIEPTATGINMPVLKNGDAGEAVRFLEQLLICYGYLSKNEFDAKFDADTKKAVEAFQKAQKLTVDGVVGKNTWRALGAACKR